MDSPQLDPESAIFIDGLVESGRYASREDVLRLSLRLMRGYEADLEQIMVGVRRGIADSEAGRVMDAEEAFDELDAYVQGLISKRAA